MHFWRPLYKLVFVLVWVAVAGSPVTTRFHAHFWSGFHAWWSSEWMLRQHLRRSDIRAGYGFDTPAWSSPTESGVAVNGVGRVPWTQVIPFVVDGEGGVR